MSYCKKEGKDQIIFVTKDDHEKPSTVTLPEDEEPVGLILPSGEINWNCPCLGGMATGPCGVEFREAFSCFHYSSAEPKGSDCFQHFKSMQECTIKYPKLYPHSNDDDEDDDTEINLQSSSNNNEEQETEGTTQESSVTSRHNQNKPT